MLWLGILGNSPVGKDDADIGEQRKALRLENDIVVYGDRTDCHWGCH